jgi:hypothetical protein
MTRVSDDGDQMLPAGQHRLRDEDSAIRQDRPAASGDEQVTCDALRLSLVATQLRVAWHAGAISADDAMEMLDRAFFEIRARGTRNRSSCYD